MRAMSLSMRTVDARGTEVLSGIKSMQHQFEALTELVIESLTPEQSIGVARLVATIRSEHATTRAHIDAGVGRLTDFMRDGFREVISAIDAPADRDLVKYCDHLTRMLRRVPLLGIDRHRKREVRLTDVYVDLDTTSYEEDADEAKPLSAVAALAKNDKLVLLGDPGSGKSVFANHLAFCLAAHTVEPHEQWLSKLPGWPAAHDYVPVLVALRDFAANGHTTGRDFRADAGRSASDLRAYVQDWLSKEGLVSVGPSLERVPDEGRAVVILDGLDEIADAAARNRTRDAIEDFIGRYDRARYVVTCRALVYDEVLRVSDLPSYRLAALNEAKIDSLITKWCHEMGRVEKLGASEIIELAERLRQAVSNADFKRLAANPLMLTAMAIVSMRKDRLFAVRSLIHREAIDLLLWRWDTRNVLERLIQEAGWNRADLKSVLSQLAYEVQKGTERRDEQTMVDIPYATIIARLTDRRRDADCLDWAHRVVAELKQRPDLLTERQQSVFCFPHRAFQEYLAGTHLSAGTNFASKACDLLNDGSYWLQAILLGIGHSVHERDEFDSPLFLLSRLCFGRSEGDERLWRDAWFAGEALAAVGLDKALGDDYGRLVVSRVRQQASAVLEQGKLSPGERVRVGAVLASIGDSRFRADRWQLPADELLGFVEVAQGPFTMGSDGNGDSRGVRRRDPSPHRRVAVLLHRPLAGDRGAIQGIRRGRGQRRIRARGSGVPQGHRQPADYQCQLERVTGLLPVAGETIAHVAGHSRTTPGSTLRRRRAVEGDPSQ